MGGGYVLDFSNRTFADFFAEHGINIDDPRYDAEGTSKAKRLRYFLRTVSSQLAGRILLALLDYRLTVRPDGLSDANVAAYRKIVERLVGNVSSGSPISTARASTKSGGATKHITQIQALDELRIDFLALQTLDDRQAAGLKLEGLLHRLFALFGLSPTAPFRIVGKQIDGAFVLDSEVYLVEAKWKTDRTSSADLLVFRGKIDGKAAFTRGLFISISGYSDEALPAISKNKQSNFIMIDGGHLFRVLSGDARLDTVLRSLVRVWCERGDPYITVAEMASWGDSRP